MSDVDQPGANAPRPPAAPQTGGEDLAGAAAGLSEKARTAASEALGSTVREAQARAQTAKTGVADEMSDVASALRVAAREMRDGSPQARVFAQMADSLAEFSETLQHKDLSEMVEAAGDFARRNPLVFLGGAALLGFAATRLAKASGGASGTRMSAPYVARPVASPPPGALGEQVYRGTEI